MPRKKKPLTKLFTDTSVDELLMQGLSIIGEEIDKIKKNSIATLRDKTAMVLLNDYLKTLVQLKREDRQAMVEAELSHLQDGELNNLAKEALTFLKKNDKKQENNEP